MLKYTLPDVHIAQSYDEMIAFNGISTFTSPEIAEELIAQGDGRYDRVNYVLQNRGRFFTGLPGKNARTFGTRDIGLSEASQLHIDPEGRGVALCAMGEMAAKLTQLDLSDEPIEHIPFDIMNINQVRYVQLKARIVDNPPSDSDVLSLTAPVGTYIAFNGGLKCDPAKLNPHGFSSSISPRASVSSYL